MTPGPLQPPVWLCGGYVAPEKWGQSMPKGRPFGSGGSRPHWLDSARFELRSCLLVELADCVGHGEHRVAVAKL